MSRDVNKTIAQINAEVQSGRSVVAAVEPVQPAETDAPAEKKVDAVTSATMKNNIYLPQMPVMMPLPPPAKDKKSD